MKYLLVFFLILLFACKKDKNKDNAPEQPVNTTSPASPKKIDTIQPQAYLPAFPGSWWKYVNEKGETVTNTTGSDYVKDSYTIPNMTTMKLGSSDTAFVPVYMGRKIWGNKEHQDTQWPYFPPVDFIPIVSDSLKAGDEWATLHENSHQHLYSRIISKDTSIVIAGKTYSPTIVLELSRRGDFPPYFRYSLEYYTKNIGMVRKENMMWPKLDSITSYMNLADYYIHK